MRGSCAELLKFRMIQARFPKTSSYGDLGYEIYQRIMRRRIDHILNIK